MAPQVHESALPDRATLVAWYRRLRGRSRQIFELLTDEAYYSQPIALRHPIVFYEGHLPAFSFNTVVKRALGGASIDASLERLFARGIDPDDSASGRDARLTWPPRDEVRAFAAAADQRVLDTLAAEELDRPGHPLLDRGEAVFAILEHEAMHQETLLYMWHRLPFDRKRVPPGYTPDVAGDAPRQAWIEIPSGDATLGATRGTIAFGWDNEFGTRVDRVEPFDIERHDTTNAAFLEFVAGGGYRDERWWSPDDWAWLQSNGVEHPLFWEQDGGRWLWRGMFSRFPLPLAWPVYVSHAEATAFARWRGARLPTEAEYQRAAFGTPSSGDRRHPWGGAEPGPEHGVFDFASWDPQAAGSHPAGASAWGVHDLAGNGWEWTSSVFESFPGFTPMASYPEYSADFFDGAHYVLKGASPATARELIRPTFRNWFRPRYPYVYATFRCARSRR